MVLLYSYTIFLPIFLYVPSCSVGYSSASYCSDIHLYPWSSQMQTYIKVQYNTENFYSAGILGVAKFKGA